jgi:ADP-ribose pyrophosphatase YjhB (NUDIX family)
MNTKRNQRIKELSSTLPLEKDYLSNLSIDCVVFGYHNKELKVLLSKIIDVNAWALPGGHVRNSENLEEAANRILEERTSVKGLFLKQFQTFGNKDRSFIDTELLAHAKTLWGADAKKINWIFTKRFVSVCYYALTEFSKVVPKPSFFDAECTWVDIHALPPMLLDHGQIIQEALKTLRRQLHHEPIGLNLLPEKFTLPELQALYETILGKKLDQRNFTKKLVSLDLLRKLNEKKHIGGHRSPTLYKFNKRAYKQALKQEIELAF